MTIFGWILVALFTFSAVNSNDTGGKIVSLLIVLGTLFWGTGQGL
jgi:hypothetical protein